MAQRRGFVPARRFDENQVRNLPAQASTNQLIAAGDAVSYVNGIIVPATAGQDPNQMGYGVVLRVYTTANRPLTHQTSKVIASGQPGRVDVLFDPDMTYRVKCETSVGPSNIGKNVVIDVSAIDASLGLSGQSVSIPASASVNDLFKIINIAPTDELGGKATSGAAGTAVEVRWNRHLLRAPTAGQ